MKTLGFFCALMQNGCLFDPERDSEFIGESDEEEDSPEDPLKFYEALCNVRSCKKATPRCSGKLVFKQNSFGRSFIQ